MWTDPINSPPKVIIKCPQDGVGTPGESACPADYVPKLFRGDNVFQAIAFDKNQSADSLAFEWWYADKSCSDVFAGPSLGKLPIFHHVSTELSNGCVGVMVTDGKGATAQAALSFEVVDQAPVANLQVASPAGATPLAGQPIYLPLFAKVTLTGKGSEDPDDDDQQLLDFRWNVRQNDTIIPMPGCPDPAKDPYLCTFASATPGTFSVELVVADNWKQSDPIEQLIVVATDQLPNIVVETLQPAPQSSPDDPPLQLPSWLDNTFRVVQVEDDGDPFPSTDPLSPYPTPPAGFIWSYKASTDPSFKRVIGETGPVFTIKANTFSPQQSIDVRVEYHDRVTACQPNIPGCSAVFRSCSKLANVCYGPDVRAQWVTWAVSFR